MKLRIIKIGNWYYPEIKVWWGLEWWEGLLDYRKCIVRRDTFEEAEEDIKTYLEKGKIGGPLPIEIIKEYNIDK